MNFIDVQSFSNLCCSLKRSHKWRASDDNVVISTLTQKFLEVLASFESYLFTIGGKRWVVRFLNGNSFFWNLVSSLTVTNESEEGGSLSRNFHLN